MTSMGNPQEEGTMAQNAASNLSNVGSIPEGCHLEPPSTAIGSYPSSERLEMSDLSSQTRDTTVQAAALPSSDYRYPAENPNGHQQLPADASLPTNNSKQIEPPSDPSDSLQNVSTEAPNTLTREQTHPAIGPATDKPSPMPKLPESTGPQLIITLLLHTGARHPYRIDERYLKKRNVNVVDNNPVNMSVYTLKELIWRDWREGPYFPTQSADLHVPFLTFSIEWEPRPSSPSSIRLIHYGKMLDDKSHLKDGKFTIGEAPHVVHMTVKPQDVVDDEDARIAKGGARDRDGNERTPGCRCILM
ncbi:hypothetical protein MMC26_007091 [Xylographa opegraphella]|nr:hypothetical protein [Xylographa opegraphella]